MSDSNQDLENTIPEDDDEPEQPSFPSRWVAALLAVLVLIVIVRVGMVVLAPDETGREAKALPTQTAAQVVPVVQEATLAPTAASQSGPTATAPSESMPESTPEPTATLTPAPLKLAVAKSVLEGYPTYFDSLLERDADMILLGFDETTKASELSRQGVGGMIGPDLQDAEGATLIRAEPYLAVVHPLVARNGFTLDELTRLANGEDATLIAVVKEGERAALELLGLPAWNDQTVLLPEWEAVKEYVATHEGTWALLPWDAVDFRVRALPVEGFRFNPRQEEQAYPLIHRLWMVNNGGLQDELLRELAGAFTYESAPMIELVGVGDIMLDRTARDMIDLYSPLFPFEADGMQALLSQADITFGNLESPISNQGTREPQAYTFRADPKVVEGLVDAGFDVLSLANNHSGDFGDIALTDTLQYLTDAGILPVGAGHNRDKAHEAKIIEANGLRVAFLAYNEINPPSYAATADSPGSASMDLKRMEADVRAAREQADLVVVSCHWGVEYTAYANARQREIAELLTRAGASLIIGHHPHVIQGVNYGESSFTTYSLGSFVFDIRIVPEALQGVALRCLMDASGIKTVEFLPYRIVDGRPELISLEDASAMLRRMQRVTKERNGFPQELMTAPGLADEADTAANEQALG